MSRQIQHDDRCAFCGCTADMHVKTMSGVRCSTVERGVTTTGVSGFSWSKPCGCRQFMRLADGERPQREIDAESVDSTFREFLGHGHNPGDDHETRAKLDSEASS